jgi:Uma2 family endonuclease
MTNPENHSHPVAMATYRMLPEGTSAELINNVLYDSPSPLYGHQSLSKILLRKLLEVVEDHQKGMVFHALFDVYLDEVSNVVQPDLIAILQPNLGIINKNGHIHGVPDLLIEILSESTRNHDLVRKKDLYQRFGVKEYWVIDPESKLACGFALENNCYVCICEEAGVLKSPLLRASVQF